MEGRLPPSFVVPSVSRALGRAASVRSVSSGTQSEEGALCLGTVSARNQPLWAERCLLLSWHRDSGRSWRREHGGRGRLPGVTSVPISLASGLLPKPGTAAWRGEVALRPSETTKKLKLLSCFWLVAVTGIVLLWAVLLPTLCLRKKQLRGQLRKHRWAKSDPSSSIFYSNVAPLEAAVHPASMYSDGSLNCDWTHTLGSSVFVNIIVLGLIDTVINTNLYIKTVKY